MGKKPVLGKGISALIPEYAEPSGQGDASRQISQSQRRRD